MEKVKIQSFHTCLYIDFCTIRVRSPRLVIFGFFSNLNVVFALLRC